MYERHWGLTDKPFRNTPDPRYLYFSPSHEEALTRALYTLVDGQGAMLLTGAVGCGKTLLLRTLLEELDPDRFEAAWVAFPNLGPDDFLRELLRQFGYVPAGWDRSALRRGLARFLSATRERGAEVLVVVDEAQTVADPDTWEEIRLLLNHQGDRRFGLTLLLAGQPELADRVASMPPLAQRVAVRAHLDRLTPEESNAYLTHRLAKAGGDASIFSAAAREGLGRLSGGVPRRLNHLADMALWAGFGEGAERVEASLVERVVADGDGGAMIFEAVAMTRSD